MKKNKDNKIKLGIFVSVGLTILIIAIYFIGRQQQLFNSTFQISGVFKDISGLQIGDNVRISGVDAGIINNIEIISDTQVRVDLDIDEKVRKFIKKDAKATIGSDGLMGNKIVIIMPGSTSKKEVQDNDVIATSQPVSIDDVMQNLKVTTSNAAAITEDLSAITSTIRSGKGTIGMLFMDTTFSKNVTQAIVNIKQGAGGFKQNMDAASHNILLRGFLKKKEKKEKKEKEERLEKENKEENK